MCDRYSCLPPAAGHGAGPVIAPVPFSSAAFFKLPRSALVAPCFFVLHLSSASISSSLSFCLFVVNQFSLFLFSFVSSMTSKPSSDMSITSWLDSLMYSNPRAASPEGEYGREGTAPLPSSPPEPIM